ncbi:30S ribosomal protein S20 [Planococcus maritimus]|uniref:Small ribosomal subunit protein bS20 n=1 Tax=Planococcus maritimus TaxID=192421 RepID=A0A150W510_PLAMR|nr:30S ribosomal protein S20 [Planococcus maritimus]ANU16996.1 30S ribosomal protein S20 [Planococcus maritimus]KYG58023.1 30S ribosomal protein S20 [Planococcus maritimus]OED32229.1 30S ribosomal protein S20 [Planococcus maritimus]QMT18765.1 30S ribosomal protein S20 [Planococcus maritimus]
MPNIKSAIKRVRTTDKKNAQNSSVKTAMRSSVKKADNAVANNEENKGDSLKAAIKQVEKAASKGLIHKNTAARRKSSLMKKA